jgi:hypothetical protein
MLFILSLFRNGIGGFFAGLWRIANFWRISPVEGVRTGSALAGGLLFLFLLFFIIGMALVVLGFDLNAVDAWLAAQGGWLDALGTLLLKAVFAFVLLICAAVAVAAVFDRSNPDRPGVVSVLIAAVVAWFAWNGLFI